MKKPVCKTFFDMLFAENRRKEEIVEDMEDIVMEKARALTLSQCTAEWFCLGSFI
jgi:hypothetical protein